MGQARPGLNTSDRKLFQQSQKIAECEEEVALRALGRKRNLPTLSLQPGCHSREGGGKWQKERLFPR